MITHSIDFDTQYNIQSHQELFLLLLIQGQSFPIKTKRQSIKMSRRVATKLILTGK